MIEEVPVTPIYLLIRTIPEGGFQLSLGMQKEEVKTRMVNEGWRVFELLNEQRFEDLSS